MTDNENAEWFFEFRMDNVRQIQNLSTELREIKKLVTLTQNLIRLNGIDPEARDAGVDKAISDTENALIKHDAHVQALIQKGK